VDLVITISEYSKTRILEHASFGEQKIVALLYPPSPHLHRITDQAVLDDMSQRHGLRKPFIVADGIKNPGALVEAYKLLPTDLREQYDIVFFSRRPDPPASVFESVSDGYGHLLVRPSNDDLMALYSTASVFAFPSWIEGLGLPPLEAMTCGAPVIASDRGSIPEVVGNAGLMTDVDDIDGMSRNLKRVLSDPVEAERLRQLGFARAAGFSWDKTAHSYLDIYRQLLTRPKSA
jgi:glycosyltransferase involved in cell wall biosynthesis